MNTPLAHLGTAICVGPFLSHAEMHDAAAMVSLPFRPWDTASRGPSSSLVCWRRLTTTQI